MALPTLEQMDLTRTLEEERFGDDILKDSADIEEYPNLLRCVHLDTHFLRDILVL
jgi:hypothetical protein